MSKPQRRYKKQSDMVGPYMKFKKGDSIAIKALKVAHNVRKLINVEYKYIDSHAENVVTSDTSPSIVLLNGCATGATATTRTGNSLRITSCQCRLTFYNNPSDAVPAGSIIRAMLVMDTKPTGALPNIQDILDTATSPHVVCAPRNLNNRTRFIIMKDVEIPLSAGGPSYGFFKDFDKVNFHTVYDDVGSGIASIQSNALYLVLGSTRASASLPPSTDYSIRLRFIDN